MKYSEAVYHQMATEFREIGAAASHMGTGGELLIARVKKLRDQGFYLETIFLISQILEQSLRLLIDTYKSRRRLLSIINEPDILADVKLGVDDEATLGSIIGVIKHLPVDKKLLTQVQRFNGIRKDAVHHLFDSKKGLEGFDEEVKEYLGSNEFVELLGAPFDEQLKTLDSMSTLCGLDVLKKELEESKEEK